MADRHVLLTGVLSEGDVDSSKRALRVSPGHVTMRICVPIHTISRALSNLWPPLYLCIWSID